jgi:hypothetical protein
MSTDACRETGKRAFVTCVGFEKVGIVRSTRALSGATVRPSGGTGCGMVSTGGTLTAGDAGTTDPVGAVLAPVGRTVGVGVSPQAAVTHASAAMRRTAGLGRDRRRPVTSRLLGRYRALCMARLPEGR